MQIKTILQIFPKAKKLKQPVKVWKLDWIVAKNLRGDAHGFKGEPEEGMKFVGAFPIEYFCVNLSY